MTRQSVAAISGSFDGAEGGGGRVEVKVTRSGKRRSINRLMAPTEVWARGDDERVRTRYDDKGLCKRGGSCGRTSAGHPSASASASASDDDDGM